MFSFSHTGPATALLKKLKYSKALRHWKIDRRATGTHAVRLIIGVGQMHPVLHGRFERFQAKKIAKVQAEIYDLCRACTTSLGVLSFGQEGFASPTGSPMRARLDPAILDDVRTELEQRGGERRFLKRTAAAWRRALAKGDFTAAANAATALNALALLQALDRRITIFPIEQREVHGEIGEGLSNIRRAITLAETSPHFQSAHSKGGKGLTKEEYAAAIERNRLIGEHNKLLSHPERDRAIFREVLEHADGPVTIFVLGNAHRHRILRLARKNTPPDALFVWLTPPALWRWRAVLWKLGVLAALLVIGGAAFSS